MASRDSNFYFIITGKTHYAIIKPGTICYINKERYSQKREKKTLPVICVGNLIDSDISRDILSQITQQQAGLLLAIDSNEERLREFSRQESLTQALPLVKDSEVLVELEGDWLQGVVRYIGSMSTPNFDPIAGVFFGVELQDEDKGKGTSDGKYNYKTLFVCKDKCGIFAPFNRIKPKYLKQSDFTQASSSDPPQTPTEQLSVGDRVIYFIDDENGQPGMVLKFMEDSRVLISTARDEKGREGGEITVPLQCVMREEDFLKDITEKMDTSNGSDGAEIPGLYPSIATDSMVEVNLATGPAYGTVRWIGHLPGLPEIMVGLELEKELGVSDGSFKKLQFFKCAPKHGLFVKLSSCRPDSRFLGEAASHRHYGTDRQDMLSTPENLPPINSEDVMKILIGRMRGIQGHCNSCYMDSALFSLFSCSSVLDCLLFKKTKQKDEAIQKTLLRDIVRPLRSKGFVDAHNVMKLRQQLQDRGHCPSYTTDEKDPEEFLTLLMQNILELEPPLKLQSCNRTKGGKGIVESSYFYQIFMDYDNSLVLPTVQQLLEHSFYNNSLRLAEVPSCLILTMPRSGKQFKMFPKIIPSLELDITALLSEGPQQCVICGHLACVECTECFGDALFSNTGFKMFCDKCSTQVHSHPRRRGHKPNTLRPVEGFSRTRSAGGLVRSLPHEKLELFAVLCIETSHYVSFVKHGPQPSDWIFFDSMADREGESNGFNIPQVNACPEVGRYLTMPLAELGKQVPREMEGVSKRLFCDGYMYLYQSPNMALYR